MHGPNWRRFRLDEGVLAEPGAEEGRIVVWLPGQRDRNGQQWERVSNVARAGVTQAHGLCATPASAIRAREKSGGVLRRWLGTRGDSGGAGERAWTLPNGQPAEQVGERRTDLLLVWSDDDAAQLDEFQIRAHWPGTGPARRIGRNLFLVPGVTPGRSQAEAQKEASPLACPRKEAERLVDEARRSGDRGRQAAALGDMGIVLRNEGDAQRAVMFLEQALALVRGGTDRAQECDLLGNLGLAVLAVGQFPQRAVELFEQELALAQAAGDRYAEKLALEHLGIAHASLREPIRALGRFEEALALAVALGDTQHRTNLLWQEAIQLAELSQRDAAVAKGQAAIGLMRALGRPQAAWYAEHLKRYEAAGPGVRLVRPDQEPESSALARSSGPGLLRMAFTAAGAMARFLGSGLKTAPAAMANARLKTCAGCEHHTGLRCRVCGCFTNVKTRMLHERCPLGKWAE